LPVLSDVPLGLEQFRIENAAAGCASHRVVGESYKADIKHVAGPYPPHGNRHGLIGVAVFSGLGPIRFFPDYDGPDRRHGELQFLGQGFERGPYFLYFFN
jgi:hypothetical protein